MSKHGQLASGISPSLELMASYLEQNTMRTTVEEQGCQIVLSCFAMTEPARLPFSAAIRRHTVLLIHSNGCRGFHYCIAVKNFSVAEPLPIIVAVSSSVS
jgi:hypothetical protein